MALATRCPHCETVFRLDPHLLAPHDGRVRCGHCQEVFDAAHHRFELPEEHAAPHEAQHAAIIDDEVAVGPASFASDANGDASANSVAAESPGVTAPATPKIAKEVEKPATPSPAAPAAVKPSTPPAAKPITRKTPAPVPSGPSASAPRPLDLGANNPPAPPAPLVPLAPEEDSDRTLYANTPASAQPAQNHPAKQFVRVDAPPADHVTPAAQSPTRPVPPPETPAARFVPPDDRAEPFIGPTPTAAEPPRPAPEPAPAADWGKDPEPAFGAKSPRPPGAAHAASANEAFPVIRESRDALGPLDPPDPEWTRPRTGWRAAGIVLSVLLVLTLIGQILWWQRESVMVYVPGTHSLYADICYQLGCTIAPPRYIDGLQIESSGLRQVDGPHKLELKLSLRNRSDVSLAYPALELTLLDDKSNVAVRRVLWPQDYARPGTIFPIGLPPQSAQPVVVRLDTGDAVAANYRVQVFYP
ncbi:MULTISPECIES: DUF3426 domain-containing protein [unclassified Caballeronia]|uniref:DUF3426 domain-containing protein n=1 Tax=unclassified Caballeronia TaxID=2646786 RepID=UPI0020296A92|nr:MULTISPECIES: DUF3426 domain-containing protein [unclassified Caballeronia]MDR5804024.1 DUF3426 domain-containing protein [Caballeronia sp. LZ001]